MPIEVDAFLTSSSYKIKFDKKKVLEESEIKSFKAKKVKPGTGYETLLYKNLIKHSQNVL